LQAKHRAVAASAVVTLAFAGLSSGTPVATAQVVGPIDCPVVMPTEDVERGMAGTGWSVVSEKEPEPFSAEILGVLNDGIAPGRDLIVADLSSPAITAAGGVWQGMSGSPVYIDDLLVGAVSRSLASGPSTLAGLTPAEDLMDLLDYPDATPTSGKAAPLGDRMERRIEAGTGSKVSSSDRFRRLRTPLSVSGLSTSGLRRLRKVLAREKAPYLAYAGASSPRPASVPVTTVGAGESFAAAFSYGDVTTASIGTTALVCDGKAVAFGHPLDWRGKTFMGANAARTLAIVDDEVNGPFKLAKVQGLAGTVDQDRLAGLRAFLDQAPDPIPVRVNAESPDTGRAQLGRSFALLDEVTPPVAFFTLIGNMDSVFDQISGGSSLVSFRIQGLKQNGDPFVVERDNAYSTHEDISITSSHELERYLWTLVSQEFQDITLTRVTVDTTVLEERDDLTIVNVLSSVNGKRFRDVRRVRVEPGDDLELRIVLRRPSGVTESAETKMKVPGRARRDGFISVTGSADEGEQLSCFFQGTICKVRLPGRIQSFSEVVEFLEERAKNNVVTTRMTLGPRISIEKRLTLGQPVTGNEFLEVDLPGGGRGGIAGSAD
jgi:SpoIVB peptidase S55